MSWWPRKRVIVPLDFSDESFAALDTALQLVESPEQVTAIHVLPDLSPLEPGEVWHTIDEESRARHARQAIRDRLKDPRYASVEIEVAFGDPGHEITAFASANGADLIVLPSHGRRGLSRILIGSVAERVVRLAHCPVLVLRT